MKKRILVIFSIVFALLLSTITVHALSFEEADSSDVGKDEIPYCDFNKSHTAYKYDTFDMLNESEAQAAGVPDGYTGHVLKLTGGKTGGLGIGLDFSQYHYMDIEKITFRVWCSSDVRTSGGLRMTQSSDAWIMVADVTTGEWCEVVLEKGCSSFWNGRTFASFDDGTGQCQIVNLCFRLTSGVVTTVYIDSITVETRDPDTEPPVISYDGEMEINRAEGLAPDFTITAHDAYYDEDITPEYIWSEGALDANGKLIVGTHTCTVRATDKVGNFSEITLTVNVKEKDVTAPVIEELPERIVAETLSRLVLTIDVTDDNDEVEPVLTFSEGALDETGRLLAGEHTLTVSATDKSGNVSTKVILIVVKDVIDDEVIIEDAH